MKPAPVNESAVQKIREFVTFAERAYLQLAARRMMNLRRAAEARGEEWHDVGTSTILDCGATVRLVFQVYDGDPRQELFVAPGKLTEAESQRVAEEVMGGDVTRGDNTGDGLYCFIRKQPA